MSVSMPSRSPVGYDLATMTAPSASKALTIRVGLEVGYDYGRAGAWMLDLPGCFVWGRDRAVALARVPSAIGSFAAWLEAHGETIEVPQTDRIEVVEELQPSLLDGYERNVTFIADRRAVSAAEVESTIRRLGFARED